MAKEDGGECVSLAVQARLFFVDTFKRQSTEDTSWGWGEQPLTGRRVKQCRPRIRDEGKLTDSQNYRC